MKKVKFLLFSIMALGLTSVHAFAQKSYGGPSFSLDFSSGYPFQSYSFSSGDETVSGFASGDYSNNLRFSFYLDGRWGVFLQYGKMSSYVSERSFLGAVNAAEGGKYRYRGSSADWSISSFFVGASYSWDCGRLSFEPRLGIGSMSPFLSDLSYMRVARDGSAGPEYFSISNPMAKGGDDFLLDESYGYEIPSLFSAAASFQVSWFFFRGLYLFLEPEIMMPFRKAVCQCDYYGSKPAYNVTTWAESMSYGDTSGLWARDPASQTRTSIKAGFGPAFSLNFGIGFNISTFRLRHE